MSIRNEYVAMSDTIAAHLAMMRREHYASTSIRDRARLLRQAARQLPNGLDQVSPDDLEAFLHNPRWSNWTRHTYGEHLAGYFAHCAAEGWYSYDPMAYVKIPPPGAARPKPVPVDEIRLALDRSCGMWLTAIMLGFFAGLRSSEIAACRREHVTREYVHVVRGKGGRERWVDTSPTLWAYVEGLPRGPLVLRDDTGAPVLGRWLSARQHKHWRRIGLPHVHLHRLRHSFCTELLGQGHDAMVIRDMMGHASTLTTQGYAAVKQAARRNAIESLDALLTERGPDCGRPAPTAEAA